MNRLTVSRVLGVSMLCAITTLAACGGGDNSSTPAAAPTVTLTASTTTLQLGGASTLSWSSANSSTCIASGSWSGTKAVNGQEDVIPPAVGNDTYTLACTGSGGSATATVTVAVTPTQMPTVTLSASPATIHVGESTTLKWSSTNATACTATGSWTGAKAPTGNESVTPSAVGSVNYALTCTGTSGSASADATVAVISTFAYVANDGGDVSAYAVDMTSGAPTEINGSPFPAGGHPRSIGLDVHHSFAYVANYGTSDISGYAVDSATGALSSLAGSPFATGGHPNAIAVAPSGKFAYVATADNGLLAYAIDATSGALTSVGTAASGSNFVTIHPSGKYAYAASTGTPGILAYTIDTTTGILTALPGSPFSNASGTVFIAFDPSGKFAYGANFSSNSISAYSVDDASGALTQIVGSPFAAGQRPRSIAIDPLARFAYVANAGGPTDAGGLSAYVIDNATGALSQMTGSPVSSGNGPGAVAIDSSGKFLYVGTGSYTPAYHLRVYVIGSTGTLTEIAGSPFVAGTGPYSLVLK